MKELEWKTGADAPVSVEKARRDIQLLFRVNFDAEQTDEGWRWLSVDVPYTWDKGKVVSSIIRLLYTADDVEAIVNNVLQDPFSEQRLEEYQALQQWRMTAKKVAADAYRYIQEHGMLENVAEEQEAHAEAETVPDGMTMLMQAVRLLKKQVVDLPDDEAAEVPALFPTWESLLGEAVEVGKRLFYAGRLWKVLQSHTIQAEWTPDVVPALFTEVVVHGEGEPEIGTLDNPIPYNGNMELEEGKYYSQDGVVYLCIRDTGNPVYHDLSDLVGLYVQVVK